LFLFHVPERSQVIATRIHNGGHKKQYEARLSKHRVVHIHAMKKKRRSTHVEGEDDFEDYITSEGININKEHIDLCKIHSAEKTNDKGNLQTNFEAQN
jgi:hypothetical protein